MIPCHTLVELVYLFFIVPFNDFGEEPATFIMWSFFDSSEVSYQQKQRQGTLSIVIFSSIAWPVLNGCHRKNNDTQIFERFYRRSCIRTILYILKDFLQKKDLLNIVINNLDSNKAQGHHEID